MTRDDATKRCVKKLVFGVAPMAMLSLAWAYIFVFHTEWTLMDLLVHGVLAWLCYWIAWQYGVVAVAEYEREDRDE